MLGAGAPDEAEALARPDVNHRSSDAQTPVVTRSASLIRALISPVIIGIADDITHRFRMKRRH